MIILLDNYDSFTWNLYQSLAGQGANVRVFRNDAVSVDEVEAMDPQGIVISPGPGRPEGAGIAVDLIRRLGPKIPVLGVCLGHQAIALAYGGRVDRAPAPFHGKVTMVRHRGEGIFHDLPDPLPATRYHSLTVMADDLPPDLQVTAWTDDGVIMGLRHNAHRVEGVQFHPESVFTPHGNQMLGQFLGRCS